MKTSRIFSLLLCLALAVGLVAAPAYADSTTITINSVTFDAYEDAQGGLDDSLVTVSISFTAPESMTQISILLAGADIQTITSSNKHQVIHQAQVETPDDGVLSFPVRKARIATATGLEDPDGATLYLRMSGIGASGTTSITVTYAEPLPNYGDINNDGKVGTVDALMILRYYVGLQNFTVQQLEAADVTQDGNVDIADAARILAYEARKVSTLVGPIS